VAEACAGAAYVYNFAGLADIDEASTKPRETVTANILGNVNVLEGARAAGAKRFLFASSVYVYSNSGSFYRASKQACERYVELFHERFGLPFTILRYGSLYGRRADDRNTIYRLVSQALTDRRMVYPGSGDELRDYIHAEDAAIASVEALKPEFENSHIVLTGSQSFRVRDVLMMIAEIMPFEVQCTFEPTAAAEHYTITPYTYTPRPGRKLMVNPFVDMGQGVLDCIEEATHRLGIELGHEHQR
jgi:UDP-glucose 4-epimerase